MCYLCARSTGWLIDFEFITSKLEKKATNSKKNPSKNHNLINSKCCLESFSIWGKQAENRRRLKKTQKINNKRQLNPASVITVKYLNKKKRLCFENKPTKIKQKKDGPDNKISQRNFQFLTKKTRSDCDSKPRPSKPNTHALLLTKKQFWQICRKSCLMEKV